jgi:hypothetical protein
MAHGIMTSYDPYHEWAMAMNATQPPDFAPRIAVFLYVGPVSPQTPNGVIHAERRT